MWLTRLVEFSIKIKIQISPSISVILRAFSRLIFHDTEGFDQVVSQCNCETRAVTKSDKHDGLSFERKKM